MAIVNEIREALPDGVKILDNPSFDNSIIGVASGSGRVIYSYDKMVEEFMKDNNVRDIDAIDWIEYNTIRALPYMGENAPTFGGSRTFHRIACAIEDAGFEIRDTIMWLYGSGFPKSMNLGLAVDKKNGVESKIVGYADATMPDFRDVGKKQKELSGIDKLTFGQIENSERKAQPIYEAQNEWKGWGSCLKPSFEPIIVARKPFTGSLVENVMEYGVGGLNIDECRVAFNGDMWKTQKSGSSSRAFQSLETTTANGVCSANENGRFPANTILTYDETDYEEVCGGFPTDKGYKPHQIYSNIDKYEGWGSITNKNGEMVGYGDSGSASRYFYCAKASKKDRDEGLDGFEEVKCSMMASNANIDADGNFTGMLAGRDTKRKNTHPTVKPTELMQYLVRLVTPNGGTVLDPFNGSGSTGKAAMYENRERNKGYKYIGIELTEEYLPIAKARIEYPLTGVLHNDKKETKVKEQPVVEQNKEVNLW